MRYPLVVLSRARDLLGGYQITLHIILCCVSECGVYLLPEHEICVWSGMSICQKGPEWARLGKPPESHWAITSPMAFPSPVRNCADASEGLSFDWLMTTQAELIGYFNL